MKCIRVLSGVAVAFCALIAASAYPSIPDANGVYTACMLKALNTIRLIDTSDPKQKCTSLETKILWSEIGPVGPRGPQGPQGSGSMPSCDVGELLMSVAPGTWECRMLCGGQLVDTL